MKTTPVKFFLFSWLIALSCLSLFLPSCTSSSDDVITFNGSGLREVTRSFTVNKGNWKISWSFVKEREAGGLEIAVFETTAKDAPPPGTPETKGPTYGFLGRENAKATVGGFISPGEAIIGQGGTFYLRVDPIALSSWQIKVHR